MTRSVVGYVSLPTIQTAGRGPAPSPAPQDELARQRASITKYARTRRWHLQAIYEGDMEPSILRISAQVSRGLREAVNQVEEGAATGILVDALARLSPYSTDIRRLLKRLRQLSAILVAIEEQLDTSKKGGQARADAFLAGAQWDRAMTGARIRIGHAKARHLRPTLPATPNTARNVDRPEILEHIHALRDQGLSLRQIAQRLEDEGVETARGGAWWPATVASALRYQRPR